LSDLTKVNYQESIPQKRNTSDSLIRPVILTDYEPNPDCPQCKGAGWVHPVDMDEKPDYRRAIHCEEPGCMADSYRAYKSGTAFLRSLSIREEQRFSNFRKEPGAVKSFEASKKFAEGQGSVFLLLCGNTGCGKTFLCNAVSIRLTERGIPFIFKESWEILDLVRASVGNGNLDDEVNKYKDIPVLIVDDYKPEYDTSFALDKFEGIISHRDRLDLPTMMTSNKDIRELPDRIRSRFSDLDKSTYCYNSADDQRPRKR